MANHVLGGEVGHPDTGGVLEHIEYLDQAGALALGQVDLGHVAGDHRGGAEADAGQEHLHLLARGVLALVENDEGIVQGAPAHVGQRRDLDHLALDQLGDLLEADHLVQGVIQRAQVGIDLLGKITGQETELLAGFHRRAHQQDASHLLLVERLHRSRHRQVGLAGAGRADAEVDVVVADAGDVALLIEAARLDQGARGTNQHLALAGVFFGVLVEGLDAGFLQEQVHGVRGQLGGLGLTIEVFHQVRGRLDASAGAGQLEHVAAVAQGDAEPAFDQLQVLVALATQVGKTAGLVGFEVERDDAVGLGRWLAQGVKNPCLGGFEGSAYCPGVGQGNAPGPVHWRSSW